jgi:hypothetical protein
MSTTTTETERHELQKIWGGLFKSPEPAAMDAIKQLFPVLLGILRHVDELQAEVYVLREQRDEQMRRRELR